MTAVDNEKLCALAQNGNMDALNSLVENNLRFIKMTAHEIWSAQIEVNRALGVTFDDLVQEGCLGLMGCVEKFNPDGGNKFLTYAAPAIRNSMIDYIRSQSTSFEAKHMGEIVSLDEVTKFENRDRHAFVPDSNMTNPAQIYIAKETHEELHAALDAISNREREYLLYRFGFEDNIEHPLTETAEHVPIGMLLTPIGNPEPRDFTPLDTPIIFSQMVPTLKKLRFTMSDLFSKMPQHTTFIFAEALQKSQPVPWGAEQKFRVCQHRKFPRHAAAAEKQ